MLRTVKPLVFNEFSALSSATGWDANSPSIRIVQGALWSAFKAEMIESSTSQFVSRTPTSVTLPNTICKDMVAILSEDPHYLLPGNLSLRPKFGTQHRLREKLWIDLVFTIVKFVLTIVFGIAADAL